MGPGPWQTLLYGRSPDQQGSLCFRCNVWSPEFLTFKKCCIAVVKQTNMTKSSLGRKGFISACYSHVILKEGRTEAEAMEN